MYNEAQEELAALRATLLDAEPSEAMIDKYCLGWVASFAAKNPFDKDIHCTTEDREHIAAGIKALVRGR